MGGVELRWSTVKLLILLSSAPPWRGGAKVEQVVEQSGL